MPDTEPRRRLLDSLDPVGLIAVLRGITPDEAPAIGEVLFDAGFRILEVPLNSPEPLASIERLASDLPDTALVGAGTVIDAADVSRIAFAGGRIAVSPNFDPAVVGAAVELGLTVLPGVATPSEAFSALAAGATALKLFPAEVIPPAMVKAVRAVLPQDTLILPTGGITPEKLDAYVEAGVNGFGLGGALYRPGDTPADVGEKARRFVSAWRAALN